jgi:hypothetical protein
MNNSKEEQSNTFNWYLWQRSLSYNFTCYYYTTEYKSNWHNLII